MLKSTLLPRLILVACITLISPLAAHAQNSSALINEALDKQVDLNLNDMLPKALKAIETQTGVPIRADANVWDILPWGDQTNLTARVQNQTLRQALTVITQKLGLTFTLGDEAIHIKLMPALRRLPGRATVQELKAVDVLNSNALPKGDYDKVQKVVSTVDQVLEKVGPSFAVENRLPPELRDAPVMVKRDATLLEALEEVTRQTQATWYPWGKSIVIVPKQTLVRDLLSLKSFTKRYAGTDVAEVLNDLERRSGVAFTYDPGALQRVPAEFRSVKAFWDNVTVAQALESLKGFTGLDYKVTDSGITISNPLPANATPAAPAQANADPVIGSVTLENNMVVFIRESQVPPELRNYMRHRVSKELETIRALAKHENFPLTPPVDPGPTTKPATQPAAPDKPKDL